MAFTSSFWALPSTFSYPLSARLGNSSTWRTAGTLDRVGSALRATFIGDGRVFLPVWESVSSCILTSSASARDVFFAVRIAGVHHVVGTASLTGPVLSQVRLVSAGIVAPTQVGIGGALLSRQTIG